MLRRLIPTFVVLGGGPLLAQVPQDSVEPEAPPPASAAIDSLSIARAAAGRGDQAEALSQYLRVLATSPNNVEALAGAGRAALVVGDVNAATGFFARAEDLAPTNGVVKAGLASATVQTGNGRAALRYFRQAQALGVPEATIAGDRGLAYDLNGDGRRAQASYQIALLNRPGDPTTTRRLALSQAISGNLPLALTTLDPLLRKQDIPAWRTRAFAKALTGDVAGAEADAALVLPRNQVATLRPYLVRLASLRTGEKAAAVFLGRFPPPGGRAAIASASPVQARRPAAMPSAPVRLSPPAPIIVADASVATALPLNASLPVARPSAPPPAAGSVSATFPPAPTRPIAPGPTIMAESATTTLPTPFSLPASGGPAPTLPKAAAAADVRSEAVVDDSPALRAQLRKVAAAKRAETLAGQKKRAEQVEAAAEAKVAKANPARNWVQVAGGANRSDLPRAWSQLKAKWPSQLSGRSPWTMHYRFTNRLLIGPFPSADAAQDWVSERKKEGLPTFRVSTQAGEPVERL